MTALPENDSDSRLRSAKTSKTEGNADPDASPSADSDLSGQRIGWIGTGVMGAAMASHLIDRGTQLIVTNRTIEKTRSLADAGATVVPTPRQVAESSEVVFTIVGHPHDVREVYLDRDAGLMAAPPAGRVYVDMTTSAPSLARMLAAQFQARDESVLDAPVSGGDVGARSGTLSIMVGGDRESFDRVSPMLAAMGSTVVHQGPAGSGQHTKMVNQTLIAGGMVAMCEALLYAEAAGLDMDSVLSSVGGGAAGSWSLQNLAPRILNGDYEPGFFVEHFLKDMRIALEEAEAMNLSMPGLALAKQLYQAVAAAGGERDGTQALYKAIRRLNGRDGTDFGGEGSGSA